MSMTPETSGSAPRRRVERARVSALEVFGLTPLGPALRQCRQAILGDAHAPPSRWGPSSLAILRPHISIPLWLGRRPRGGDVIVYQLPNRRLPPPHEGYSVRRTYARDFRDRRMTYDGHVGTDFATPVGTWIVAAAPGRVMQVRNDMQRGGLKIVVDHGAGLITTSNHMARAVVQPGDRVGRGDPLGLSGMSGVDGVLFSPWLAPHLHFNVLLDGVPADPWARADEVSLWRTPNAPTPHRADPGGRRDGDCEPTAWDRGAVREAVAACTRPDTRAELEAIADPDAQAVAVAIARLFFGYAFPPEMPLVTRATPRAPRLDLPFRAADYSASVMADDLPRAFWSE
ncbi:MAG: peptidoglycan DD-metalloendopeptidase family protein [Planctomycetota bacterium]|jgi:murein DD-endopeptidase MepM/ murein hydrolase activator NlpD